MFENIHLYDIKNAERNVHFADESYLISYPEIIKYFKNIKIIKKSNLIIGIHFAYGWMPTAFDFRSNEFEKALKILSKARTKIELSTDDLTVLKCLFNNSIVGTSKLLHFINPIKYAIWDSRVCTFIKHGKPNYNLFKKPETYLEYLNFCNKIIEMRGYNIIHQRIKRKIRNNISKLRSLELIMYFNGKTND
jgi:hypothetical protein